MTNEMTWTAPVLEELSIALGTELGAVDEGADDGFTS